MLPAPGGSLALLNHSVKADGPAEPVGTARESFPGGPDALGYGSGHVGEGVSEISLGLCRDNHVHRRVKGGLDVGIGGDGSEHGFLRQGIEQGAESCLYGLAPGGEIKGGEHGGFLSMRRASRDARRGPEVLNGGFLGIKNEAGDFTHLVHLLEDGAGGPDFLRRPAATESGSEKDHGVGAEAVRDIHDCESLVFRFLLSGVVLCSGEIGGGLLRGGDEFGVFHCRLPFSPGLAPGFIRGFDSPFHNKKYI